jgi:hypothetical protein
MELCPTAPRPLPSWTTSSRQRSRQARCCFAGEQHSASNAGRVAALREHQHPPARQIGLTRSVFNQIECHPYFQQREVQALNILTQAWSPIGGITFYRDGSRGSTLEDPSPTPTARRRPR